jgi:hypothetical protein
MNKERDIASSALYASTQQSRSPLAQINASEHLWMTIKCLNLPWRDVLASLGCWLLGNDRPLTMTIWLCLLTDGL